MCLNPIIISYWSLDYEYGCEWNVSSQSLYSDPPVAAGAPPTCSCCCSPCRPRSSGCRSRTLRDQLYSSPSASCGTALEKRSMWRHCRFISRCARVLKYHLYAVHPGFVSYHAHTWNQSCCLVRQWNSFCVCLVSLAFSPSATLTQILLSQITSAKIRCSALWDFEKLHFGVAHFCFSHSQHVQYNNHHSWHPAGSVYLNVSDKDESGEVRVSSGSISCCCWVALPPPSHQTGDWQQSLGPCEGANIVYPLLKPLDKTTALVFSGQNPPLLWWSSFCSSTLDEQMMLLAEDRGGGGKREEGGVRGTFLHLSISQWESIITTNIKLWYSFHLRFLRLLHSSTINHQSPKTY